ncbi:helix-turn-helix transcriptional regulator [Loigolactobacillus backii]|uniref:helix-turn-helix transcriptional regulator n=1 Tax=Loigolactobacillus backii TaxID=375175 RepID=UPI0013043EC6|nr:helix-turn-helix transcriptional regulator [Loigolactobacillus backii]MDA5388578.1 helix-turn-helix domain-containing protein [Loigolactobacillus backii]MDA5391032.1 helix-turn-helix domain-containing protein [Loigolactobacillus backii]
MGFMIKNTLVIKRKIAMLGMNQTEFSLKIGISKSFMSQILSKRRNCSPKIAIKIADELGQNMNDIFLLLVSDYHTNKEAK